MLVGKVQKTYQLPTIGFPGRDLIFAGHREMDRVHHHTISGRSWLRVISRIE